MNQLIKFGLILCVICLVATLVLAATYQLTKPAIDAQLGEEESEALKSMIPDADRFEEKTVGGIEYFEAYKNNTISGYCLRATGSGYNGHIRMIVGIDAQGVIKGIRVLEQQETPGLGAQINHILPGEKEPVFLKQFTGKSGRTVQIKKDIDAITGATISSKAVTDAVRETVNSFLSKVKR